MSSISFSADMTIKIKGKHLNYIFITLRSQNKKKLLTRIMILELSIDKPLFPPTLSTNQGIRWNNIKMLRYVYKISRSTEMLPFSSEQRHTIETDLKSNIIFFFSNEKLHQKFDLIMKVFHFEISLLRQMFYLVKCIYKLDYLKIHQEGKKDLSIISGWMVSLLISWNSSV